MQHIIGAIEPRTLRRGKPHINPSLTQGNSLPGSVVIHKAWQMAFCGSTCRWAWAKYFRNYIST